MRGGTEKPEAPAIPPPRANPDLVGHEAAECGLRRLFDLDRLPHAILLHGPRGVGKATLAFRFARFVLAGAAERLEAGPSTGSGGLAIDPKSGVFRRVAAGGHADLLTVERAWDPQRRRLRGEILVEDVREIAAFLRLTPAEEGWRIVVVDGAEEMNASAANALLKILEEPPQRALLLLVSHNPGRLLPTIRSRCRRLPLPALSPALVRQLIAQHRPGLAADEADAVAALAQGSIGRALELADAGGLGLYRALLAILSPLPAIDVPGLHAFADRLARPEAEDGYRTATELLTQFLARLAAAMARRLPAPEIAAGEGEVMRRLMGGADPARWAHLVDELGRRFARTDGLNLDKKQALLGAVFAIARLAR
ncbi:MAG TPA: DNA polymerase III subunit delta' [Stellaceae bacterium]|nr:DNA polymerase III subunit delta' [Stellaceae bacterium]